VIAALLAEVGDTVMPARVILSTADKEVALAVAGRRVQGLLGASSDALGDATDLVDRVLDSEDETGPKKLGEVVRSVAEGPGPFLLRSEVASRLGAEAEPGLTPIQLQDLWNIANPDASPLERFLRKSEAQIRGGIITANGAVSVTVGDPTLSEPLVDVLEAAWPDFQAEREKIAKDHSDPSLTCWQQSGGPVVAVAQWPGSGIAALAFLPDQLVDVLSIWNSMIAED
jgi:hypothetical protein